jgi:hypothetical protein
MTKTNTILFASLALILALGVCLPQALAADNLRFHAATIRVPEMPQAIPAAAAPLIQQGATAMGPTPPTTGVVNGVQTGPPSWPCFPTSAPCSSDPAGGYLGAIPQESFSITTCEVAYNSSNGTGGCGQLWWTFETSSALTCPTAGCPLSVAITAKEGSNTLYSLPLTNIGTIPAPSTLGGPYVEVIYGQQGFGTTWDPSAVNPTAGNVTVTVTTQVTAGTTTTTKVTAKGSLVVAVQ